MLTGAKALAERLPDARVHVLEGSGPCGITSGVLEARDTNALDGQSGRISLDGFARY
jgi:hypothetical protein